jgi:hypothetical protein
MKKISLLLICLIILQLHTFSQQNTDSVSVDKTQGQVPWVVPAVLAGGGLAFFALPDQKHQIQEYLQPKIGASDFGYENITAVAPVFICYGASWLGADCKNDFYNRTLILIRSEILAIGTTYILKYATQVNRPNNENKLSFPSNHTAQAFLGAAFLDRELRDQSVWYSISAYSLATATGLMRIGRNKHWLPDVLMGAALGISAVNISYAVHKQRNTPKFVQKYINTFSIMPLVDSKSASVAMVINLR